MTAPPSQGAVNSAAFRASGVTRRFGHVTALADVHLAVPESAVFLLAGANGAGKTTLLRLFLGLLEPTGGAVTVFGLSPTRNGGHVRAAIGYVPESGSWPADGMTIRRFLDHHRAYRPRWDPTYAEHLARALDLRMDRRIRDLSKGEFRRAQVVAALAHRPPGLVLDEPTDGLDPLIRDRLKDLLADHLSDGPTTVLLSTHLIHAVESFADHLAIISAGRVRDSASREELHRNVRRIRLVPPVVGWEPPTLPRSRCLKREMDVGEERWTVWGPTDRVVATLRDAGADITEIRPLTLEDTAIALLSAAEGNADVVRSSLPHAVNGAGCDG